MPSITANRKGVSEIESDLEHEEGKQHRKPKQNRRREKGEDGRKREKVLRDLERMRK